MIIIATIYLILSPCKHLNIWKQLKYKKHVLNVDCVLRIEMD